MADGWITRRLKALRGFLSGETSIRDAFLAAADAWAARVRDAVLAPFHQAGHAPNAHAITSQNDYWQQQLQQRMKPSLLDVLRSGWASAFGKQPPASFDQTHTAQQFLVDSVNRMVRTPDEVYREIAASIADGINNGDAIPDIAARVDQLLTVTGTENWARRATVVARTETQAAMQTGAIAAARAQAADEGEPYDKVWLSTADARTRPTHVAADQQRVSLDQKFTVGEAQLDHPGDPTGPAHEVIQCRCSLLFVRSDEPATSLLDRQNP